MGKIDGTIILDNEFSEQTEQPGAESRSRTQWWGAALSHENCPQ